MSEENRNNTAVEHEYGADQIQILEGLEAVRKRPGMYIGTTSSRGLHHLVYEIVDNAVDEALAGFCDTIDVTINEDNSITVIDNGRGIPVGINHKAGIPAVEVVFTILHAGGKFGGGGYKVSGGLHGVGASVVNALSNWLEVEICQGGKVYKQRYERGHVCYALKEIGTCPMEKTGTKVTFLPDDTIFTETTVYDFDVLKRRLREMAFLTKGLRIILRDNRTEEEASLEAMSAEHENEQIRELLQRAQEDAKDTSASSDDSVSDAAGNEAAALTEAKTTPYGRYPETITYTLAKMTGVNNSNLPEGETYEDNAYTRLIREIINVQNEDVYENYGDTYNVGISTMIATGNIADIMVVDQKTMNAMQKNDQLADLTEVYANCASDRIKDIYASYGEEILQGCTFDGKLMAFPETNISDGPNLLWVRKDWMEKLGLSVPETIDDVKHIALTFAEENPANQEMGNIGLAVSTTLYGGTVNSSEYGMNLIFASFGAYPGRWLTDAEGMPVYGSVQPNVKDALGMLADWYQEGVLDRDFLIRTQDDIAELIAQGRCGIFFAPWWAPNNPLWRCHETDPEADWQPFLIRTGKDGSVRYCNEKLTGNYVVVRKGYE